VRSADSAGFEGFYTRQWSDLFGYLYSLCADRSLAEELTQEAMTRLFSKWPVKEPRPYSFRIATNLVRDHAAASRRTDLNVVEPVARAVGVDVYLLDAVRRLPRRETEVVLLHYYADLPLTDVAVALRRPVGTVKRQLHQARTSLALVLGDSHD
jgi:RNA polymerase sigma-70 factor (ECF subfamily)